MRRLLKKLFYRNIPFAEYSSIALNDTIDEKVFLKTKDLLTDVSENHWLLCLQPVIFGIWISKSDYGPKISANENFSLLFQGSRPPKKLSNISLSYFASIEEEEGRLILLKAKKCNNYHTTRLEAILLYSLYFHKAGFSFKTHSLYAAAFSYPRKVKLISFQHNDYYNIFPMDLTGSPVSTNFYLFGLRHSSISLAEIIKEKKLVVADVPFTHKNIIYELGRHHSSAPPSLKELSFQTVPTKHFCFPVPEWTEKYNEIGIEQTMNLGSHMLLWGRSEHEETFQKRNGNLYHIHFLLSLLKNRNGTAYTEV